MPKAIPVISAFHNLSAGISPTIRHLSAQVDTRKRSIAGEVIRRGVPSVPQRPHRQEIVCTLDRAGIERAMCEGWVARLLKWSKRSVSRQWPAPAPSRWQPGEGATMERRAVKSFFDDAARFVPDLAWLIGGLLDAPVRRQAQP